MIKFINRLAILCLLLAFTLTVSPKPLAAQNQDPTTARYLPEWDISFKAMMTGMKKSWAENTKAIAESLEFYNNMVRIANQTLSIMRKTRDYLHALKNWQELVERQKKQVRDFLKYAYQPNSDWLKTRFGYAPSQLSIVNDINWFVDEGNSIARDYNTLMCDRDDMLYCKFSDVDEKDTEEAREILAREALYTRAKTSSTQSEMYLSQLNIDQAKRRADIKADKGTDLLAKREMLMEMDRVDSLEVQKHILKQQIETNKILTAIYYNLSGGKARTPYGYEPLDEAQIRDVLSQPGSESADYFAAPPKKSKN